MVRECAVVCLLALGGCSLVLDFGKGAIPVDAELDAPYTQDECDYLEPNNSLDMAALFAVTDVGPAAICAGEVEDRDFYKFTVPPATASVTLIITFMSRATGDLDLRLYDVMGTLLGRSTGFVDVETLRCPGASPICPTLMPGDYVFEVYPAVLGSVNRYDISLTITPM